MYIFLELSIDKTDLFEYKSSTHISEDFHSVRHFILFCCDILIASKSIFVIEIFDDNKYLV